MRPLPIVAAFAVMAFFGGSVSGQTIGFGTTPQGSLNYRVGIAIANLMNQEMDTKVRVQPFTGTATYVPIVNSDELQLGLINAGDVTNARKGLADFAGNPQKDLRIISAMYYLPASCLVVADSPIKSVADLKGKRMPSSLHAMPNMLRVSNAILATENLTAKDTEPFQVANIFQGVAALGEGRVDAVCVGAGVAATQKAAIQLRNRGGVRYLPVPDEPEKVKAMQAVMPSRIVYLEPASHLTGVIERTPFMAFTMFFVSNDKTPEELVYKVSKLIHGGKAQLVKSAKVLARFDPERMAEAVDVPYHPGAIKFFKEIGQWPPKE